MDAIPWPKRGEKLFVDSGEYYEFSHFGWADTSTEFIGYAEGYKGAGDQLVDTAIASQDIRSLDTWVYPILFSYRQYLELEMKWLVLTYAPFGVDEKMRFLNDARHNLLEVWKRLKSLLLEDANDKASDDLQNVESYITQFHEFDKSSFTFRYPVNKELDRLVPKEHRINLRNLKARMEELYHFFDGVAGFLDQKCEYEDEFAQYFP